MTSTTLQENRPGPVILGRYELLEQIGTGGFSTVYRAYDHKMERQVAVKAVRRTGEPGARATREARAAAKLGHPHIMTVFELAEDDRHVYLVSELVEGRSLKQCISSASLTDRDCLEITLQVLSALEHAHERGVIHRDVKPDNIMLADERDPRVKVMDFGIAQLEDTQRLTGRGDVVGTLAYMSPEQADGRTVDSGTDVYSAALTLYECLTGSNPFRGSTAAETIGRIQAGALPLSHVRPDLPQELSQLVEGAVEPDPQCRLGLKSFATGIAGLLPEVSGSDQATTVLKRADLPRPTLYQDLAGRFGFLAARAANAFLGALLAGSAVYGSSYYPAPWRLPLVLGSAALVGLLPRTGLVALAGVALLPVFSFSPALGAVLAGAAAVYFLAVGLTSPHHALLPVLAAALQPVGLALAYPAASGAMGRLKRGPVLAFLGGVAFTAFQLFSGAKTISYLGVSNTYDLTARLAGEYKPWSALAALAAPIQADPVLALQPAVWLLASLPAAILIRKRNLLADLAGLALANGLLAAGYFALPLAVSGFELPQGPFLKTLALCVIIQVVVLLTVPRAVLKPPSPRERT